MDTEKFLNLDFVPRMLQGVPAYSLENIPHKLL